MRIKLAIAGVLPALALLILGVSRATLPSAEATDSRGGFTERDIRGDYSVAFDGEITEGPVVGHIVAVGVVHADGRGNFTFRRMVNINGMAVLPQTGVCTYSVRPSGMGSVDCRVSTPDQPEMMETFALTIVSRREVDFVSTTPGAASGASGRSNRGVPTRRLRELARDWMRSAINLEPARPDSG